MPSRTDAALSLSPSRISTFTQCPARYQFRYILKTEEPQSEEAARGNRVHDALEQLYALPPAERTPAAIGLDDPLDQQMLAGAFTLEAPERVRVLGRELDVGFLHELHDGRIIWMHGIIDRLDRLPAGYGITDYKTGKVPEDRYAAKALWQLLYYALCYWKASQQMPIGVQLLYLLHKDRIWTGCDSDKLLHVEIRAARVADAILKASDTDTWPATRNPLCDWCHFKENGCPAWT